MFQSRNRETYDSNNQHNPVKTLFQSRNRETYDYLHSFNLVIEKLMIPNEELMASIYRKQVFR